MSWAGFIRLMLNFVEENIDIYLCFVSSLNTEMSQI